MASKRKEAAALVGRSVRLFKSGRRQYVRIPRKWELPGREAVIRKDGDRLIVTPAPKKSLLAALRRLGPLPKKDRMPPIDHFPPEAIDPLTQSCLHRTGGGTFPRV